MRQYIFMFFIIWVTYTVSAQIPQDPKNLQSPNIATLGLFGEIPVSPFTGTPSIGILLDNIQDGDIEFQLSMDYHSAGIRPDQHPGWTGLGWGLQAGGAIYRVVNNMPDDYNNPKYHLGANSGYYFNHNVLNTSIWNERTYLRKVAQSDKMLLDTEPDEFNFSFLGYSGKFYLSHDGIWQVQCDKPLKVQFNGIFLDIPFDKRGTRAAANGYFPCFSGFTIYGEDGTSYIFGGKTSAIDYSMGFFSQYLDEWTASAWYLTKIVTPKKNEAIFEYERGNFTNQMYISVYEDRGSYTEAGGGIFNPQPECGAWNSTSIPASYNGKLLAPVYLTSITTPNTKISFIRSQSNELAYPSNAYFWNYSNWLRSGGSIPFLPVLKSEEDGYPKCLERLKWYMLDEIAIENKDKRLVKKTKFTYNNTSNERLLLCSIREEAVGGSQKIYSFGYNQVNQLPGYLSNRTDHWGFYNNTYAYIDTNDYYSQREPNPSVLLYGVLNKITYPTGGYTRFVFEPHSYRKQLSMNRWEECDSLSTNKTAGGLRIKQIINSSSGNSQDEIVEKDYFYVTDYLVNGINSKKTSGVLYSLPIYELSPLNRLLERYGPGEEWQLHSRSVKMNYLVNVFGNDTLNCIYYSVNGSANDTILTLTRVKSYASSELFVTRIEDEDGSASFDFKDKLGQVILTRSVLRKGTSKTILDTYYVYDNFGNLVAVLPPEASAVFQTASSSVWRSDTDQRLLSYAYLYCYDSRNLQIAKKLPGCNWTLYIYDRGNRLIFSQDGNMRARSEWYFSIPDAQGKDCFSGLCKNTFNIFSSPLISAVVKADWQAATSSDAGDGPYKGYYLSGVSLVSPAVLLVNYYNDYSFLGKNGVPIETDPSVSYDADAESEGFGQRYTTSAQGLLTGALTACLDNSGIPSYLYSVMYYDSYSQLVQAKSSNHLVGGVDKEYTAYNFVGQPVKKKSLHSATGKPTQTEVYSYTYDHAGRLLTATHQLNNGSPVVLVSNEYDELGRLKSNSRNGISNLKTAYTYNVRSWVKSIAGPLFNEILYYNDRRPNGTNISCYNGNISGIDWKVASDKYRGYNFSYDNFSQLTSASYLESNVLSDKFSTSYSYDKHGNMLSLNRHGNIGTSTYGIVDDLTFSYDGNQLVSIEDKGTNPSLSMSMDFKDGSHESIEYVYDANGNMVQDLNKGISRIEYNFLNLPRRLTFTGVNNRVNEYAYSADGKKLSVIHKQSTEKRTDYVSNMIYENGSLKRILVDGGYVENGTYHFCLQDHLGNNRVVAKFDGTVVQATRYYPYGMSFAESTFADKQPYKYNGKELDMENGLNLYDYGARQMDTSLGRFISMDRFSEKYYSLSPYQYVANNPMNNLDVNGDSIWFSFQFNDAGKANGITMHVAGTVLNDSKEEIDLQAATKSITQALRRTYKGKIDDIPFNIDVQLTAANSMEDVLDSDHLFVLTDKIHQPVDGENYGISNYIGGKVAFINSAYFSGWCDEFLGSRNYGSFTAAHEFGHLAGLGHSKSPINVMRSSGMFYRINESQLKKTLGSWQNNRLNLNPNYIIIPPGLKRPNTGNASPIVKSM